MSGPSTSESRLNSYLLSSCGTPRLGLLSAESEHGQHLRQCASALSSPSGPASALSSAPFAPLALPYMPYLGALTQMDLQMYAALAASTAATPLTAFRSTMPMSAHSPLFASMAVQPLAPPNNETRSEQDKDFACSPKVD